MSNGMMNFRQAVGFYQQGQIEEAILPLASRLAEPNRLLGTTCADEVPNSATASHFHLTLDNWLLPLCNIKNLPSRCVMLVV